MADTVSEREVGDALCAYLTRRHYENFLVSSWLAPVTARLHLRRVYAFCRLTDDLGDESATAAQAEARLALWREDLARCFEPAVPPLHPALFVLAETIQQYRLPREPFFDLIAANVQDQHVTRYATWDDLLAYCHWSAAPVGRLVLRLFGCVDPALDALSDDVCIGLQLANFAQDVSVDRRKGRTYLPQSDLATLGTVGAVQAMCERALQLLASGRTLEARVGGRLRLQLALYRLGGEAIIEAIGAAGYQTERVRPRVSTAAKVGLLAVAGREWLRRGERHVVGYRTA